MSSGVWDFTTSLFRPVPGVITPKYTLVVASNTMAEIAPPRKIYWKLVFWRLSNELRLTGCKHGTGFGHKARHIRTILGQIYSSVASKITFFRLRQICFWFLISFCNTMYWYGFSHSKVWSFKAKKGKIGLSISSKPWLYVPNKPTVLHKSLIALNSGKFSNKKWLGSCNP